MRSGDIVAAILVPVARVASFVRPITADLDKRYLSGHRLATVTAVLIFRDSATV